jgi:hypothetical protein
MISGAEKIEVFYYVEGFEEGGEKVLVLDTEKDISRLAESISIRGVWVPWDYLGLAE